MLDDISDKLTSEDMEDRNPKPFIDFNDPGSIFDIMGYIFLFSVVIGFLIFVFA